MLTFAIDLNDRLNRFECLCQLVIRSKKLVLLARCTRFAQSWYAWLVTTYHHLLESEALHEMQSFAIQRIAKAVLSCGNSVLQYPLVTPVGLPKLRCTEYTYSFSLLS